MAPNSATPGRRGFPIVLLAGIVGLGLLVLKAVWLDSAAGAPHTIVFAGDSITQQADYRGGFLTLLRHQLAARPGSGPPRLINAGRSGNRVPDLEARFDRDVIACKPDEVVVFIGINDVWHSLRGSGTPLVEFEAGLQRLVAKALEGGARVTLCTPTVIGELPRGKNPLDEQLDAYAEAIRRIAAERRTGLVDFRQVFQDHLQTHNPDRRSEGVLTTDGVHLNAAGNALVAALLLRHFDAEHE